MLEARWRREGEEGEGRLRAHRGEVGEVDGEQPARHERRVEAGDEVGALDLAVDGHRPRAREPQQGRVVADQARRRLAGGAPQPVEQGVLAPGESAPRGAAAH